MNIKFYRAGDCSNKLSDVFSEFIYAYRFYCSIDNLFIHHHNKYTTVIEIDIDLFKSIGYHYDRKLGRYKTKRLPFESELSRFKTTLLEHSA